jgi:hypothetical protein
MEQIPNKEKEEEKKKTEEKTVSSSDKSVSFFKLQYEYCKKMDVPILIFALCGSFGMAISMPLFAITFGASINSFASPDPNAMYEGIKGLVLQFIYIGLGMFAASFIMIWLWSYNGRIISKRIKKDYFKLLMNQDQSFYDFNSEFDFATKIQTQIKTIEMGVIII